MCGANGDTRGVCRWFVERALQLFAEELETTFAPSLVTFWLGANDASLPTGCDAYQHVPLDVYRANIVLAVRTLAPLLPPRAQILLITPPAVIDDARRACSASGLDLDRSNDAAAAYARACVEIGQAENVPVLDLHTYVNATYPDDVERGALFSDGLHFSALGNAVVTQQIADKIAEMFDKEEAARFDAWQLPNWRDLRSS